MNSFKVIGNFNVTVKKKIHTLTNIEVGGSLIVTEQCEGLEKLILKGKIKIKGDILCKMPQGCDLVVDASSFEVGGKTDGFNAIDAKESHTIV